MGGRGCSAGQFFRRAMRELGCAVHSRLVESDYSDDEESSGKKAS